MNVLGWIILGLIAGAIANLIDPDPARGGLLGAIILGIGGALVGGFLANLLFGISVTGFDFTSFIVATLGALVLLYLGKAFRRTS